MVALIVLDIHSVSTNALWCRAHFRGRIIDRRLRCVYVYFCARKRGLGTVWSFQCCFFHAKVYCIELIGCGALTQDCI